MGGEIPYEVGEKLASNTVFLRDIIENRLEPTRDDWHPEDFGLYPSESAKAKGTETLHHVIEFLKRHNLPWEETPLG